MSYPGLVDRDLLTAARMVLAGDELGLAALERALRPPADGPVTPVVALERVRARAERIVLLAGTDAPAIILRTEVALLVRHLADAGWAE